VVIRIGSTHGWFVSFVLREGRYRVVRRVYRIDFTHVDYTATIVALRISHYTWLKSPAQNASSSERA
jgi:hypothetical protein